jgi:hypothetical protein
VYITQSSGTVNLLYHMQAILLHYFIVFSHVEDATSKHNIIDDLHAPLVVRIFENGKFGLQHSKAPFYIFSYSFMSLNNAPSWHLVACVYSAQNNPTRNRCHR